MATVPERLATLESHMVNVESDVAEIKADVKTLLLANASGSGVLSFFQRIAPWAAIAMSILAVVSK